MSTSSLIEYILNHNELVIQWLIVLIIGMVAFLIGRSLFQKPKNNSSKSSVNAVSSSEQVELLLAQILERTQGWSAGPTSIESSGGGGAGSAPSTAELESARKELSQLKSLLKTKEDELNNAKSGAPAASGQNNGKEYQAKIEELEAKLAEYEVLEDDIADLSLYKEENARLKAEVERLKGDSDSSLESSPGMSVPEPDSSEDLVREFAEAVGKDSGKEIDDLEDEPLSEPAVQAQAPVQAAEPKAEPEIESQGAVDDLFAELASSDLDTDKVVSELEEIESLKIEATSEEALNDMLDPEKIAAEADELKS